MSQQDPIRRRISLASVGALQLSKEKGMIEYRISAMHQDLSILPFAARFDSSSYDFDQIEIWRIELPLAIEKLEARSQKIDSELKALGDRRHGMDKWSFK